MSNDVFPALPGRGRIQRTAFRPGIGTVTHKTAGGKQQRTQWTGATCYRYRIPLKLRTTVNAPAPWQAYTEIGVVLRFHDAHGGALDSFLWTDPYDNVQRRVHFMSDECPVKDTANGLWEGEIELESVL